ncbi:MAG: hypothetical protein ABJB10_07255 [Mesorhizobium sp.]
MSATEKHTFSLPADAAVERWLREEVAPSYDTWEADLGRGISPEAMAERARKRHAARSQRNA